MSKEYVRRNKTRRERKRTHVSRGTIRNPSLSALSLVDRRARIRYDRSRPYKTHNVRERPQSSRNISINKRRFNLDGGRILTSSSFEVSPRGPRCLCTFRAQYDNICFSAFTRPYGIHHTVRIRIYDYVVLLRNGQSTFMMIIIIIIIRVFGLAASEISDFLNDSAVERI